MCILHIGILHMADVILMILIMVLFKLFRAILLVIIFIVILLIVILPILTGLSVVLHSTQLRSAVLHSGVCHFVESYGIMKSSSINSLLRLKLTKIDF